MPIFIDSPTIVAAVGTKPKKIEEFFGRVNSKTEEISIARMSSPSGWLEPAQQPEFDEYTVVLKGELHVESDGETKIVGAGQAVLCPAGERVRYSTPGADGAEYVAICLPAFSPEKVNRDSE